MSEEIEQRVIRKIEQRRNFGRQKYQTTMERQDLTRREWLKHAQEEALDLAIYLEKLLDMETDYERMTYEDAIRRIQQSERP